jgi:hypothetical protein
MTNKTLTDVANTQPGQFVSGKFTATMSKTAERQSKSGNSFYKAVMSDGIVTIDVTSFSRDLRPFEGQLVTIGGMGIKRGEDYKGVAQISLGDKAVISSQGASLGHPADVGAPGASKPAESKTMRVEGVTIGACLNKAVDIAISNGTVEEDDIWKLASRLLRVQNRLATGDIEGLAK